MAARGPEMRVRWEVLVFLFIIVLLLALSIERLIYPWREAPPIFRGLSSETRGPSPVKGNRELYSSNEIQLLDLGCVESISNTEMKPLLSSMLRVSGRVCERSRHGFSKLSEVQVHNLTTGESGTVFVLGSQGQFKTDAIRLAEGKNIIRVDWVDKDLKTHNLLEREIFKK